MKLPYFFLLHILRTNDFLFLIRKVSEKEEQEKVLQDGSEDKSDAGEYPNLHLCVVSGGA